MPFGKKNWFVLAAMGLLTLSCTSIKPITLRSITAPNQSHSYSLTVESDTEISARDERHLSSDKQTMEFEFFASQVYPDGSTEWVVTFRALDIWHVNEFAAMRFDSKARFPSGSYQDSLSAIFPNFLGQQMRLTLSHSGEVLQFFGADKIINRLTGDFRSLSLANFKSVLLAQMGDSAFEDYFVQIFGTYPPGSVRPGATWHRTTASKSRLQLERRSDFQLEKIMGTTALVERESALSSLPGSPPMQLGTLHLTPQLAGHESNHTEINLPDGLILHAQTLSSLSGKMNVETSDGPAEFDVSVRSRLIFKKL